MARFPAIRRGEGQVGCRVVPDSPGKERIVGWLLLGLAMVVSATLLFWLQRDLAFADDSFNWLVLSGLGSNDVLIQPYGGHLIFTPLLLFKLVTELAGASYTGFGVVQVALLLTLSALIYEYGRRRVGPLLALPGAVLVLFLGAPWNVMLQPMIGIQFLCALVPGVAALLALERDDRKGDVAACVLLVLATWGFEMGFAFAAGAAVSVSLRDDRWRRAWIVAIPIAIYGIWRIWATKYGGDSGLDVANLLWTPMYVVDSFGVVAVSLFGLYYWVGHGQLTLLKLEGFDLSHFAEGVVILALGAIAALLTVRRLRRRGAVPATFWVAVAVLLSLWVEQSLALSPVRTPGEVRYLFAGGVAFLLVAIEAARGVRVTRLSLLVAAALTVAAVVGNMPRFKEGRDVLTEYSPPAKAAVTVMLLGGDNVSPEFSPATDAPEAFTPGREVFLGAGQTGEVAARFGSLGFSPAELATQAQWVRRSADIVAAHALEVHTAPAGRAGSGCRLAPSSGDAVTLPRGGAVLVSRRSSPVLAGRFADGYVIEVGEVGPSGAVLRIPGDAAQVPWRVQASDSGGLTACPLSGGSG
jgi:hypothetical protein